MRIVFLFALILLNTGLARAFDENRFQYSLSLCKPYVSVQKNPIKYLEHKKQEMVFAGRGFKSVFLPSQLPDMIQVSSQTQKLIESDEYWLALRECFGDNPHYAMFFTTNVILLDTLGHIAGFQAYVTLGLLTQAFAAIKIGTIPLRYVFYASGLANASRWAYQLAKEKYEKTKIEKTPGYFQSKIKKSSTLIDDETARIVRIRINELKIDLKNAKSSDESKLIREQIEKLESLLK